MKNETAIKLVRDACSKQPEDGKFVLYENDIELIAQGFNHIVRAEALEEAAKVCQQYHDKLEELGEDDYQTGRGRGAIDCAAAIRGLK